MDHAVSGARAAVMAAFTAEVTSSPEDEDPYAACRMELRSIEDDDPDPRRELSAEKDPMRFPLLGEPDCPIFQQPVRLRGEIGIIRQKLEI